VNFKELFGITFPGTILQNEGESPHERYWLMDGVIYGSEPVGWKRPTVLELRALTEGEPPNEVMR